MEREHIIELLVDLAILKTQKTLAMLRYFAFVFDMEHISERFDPIIPSKSEFLLFQHFWSHVVNQNVKTLIHENFAFLVLNQLGVVLIRVLKMAHAPK